MGKRFLADPKNDAGAASRKSRNRKIAEQVRKREARADQVRQPAVLPF
jgi:hypothetical protein